ncbi:PREDICTED: uncharacterized protein LOC109582478 [Amphimedon queenslandica]|uniref:Uncharacterized protein n=1 Tax=Amphimedon queenslandica TaxID=400682 RepID=A0A1X7UQP3_AMPQE|nr:PREDICTED: uncharacterized protein LOC109582478 [Amphimedon queenslandica]|eukprot:XP_019852753.1 PREDICTED: uncharacterized protein LOC109582478 [Amphimedon queenslandica]
MAEGFVPATKEYEVLKKNASKLQQAITYPNLLSMELFSGKLIPFQILQKVNAAVNTSDALNLELIINLLQAVVTDPGNFHKLLQILENHPPLLTAVAKEMKEDYAKISCQVESQSLPDSSKDLSGTVQQKTINVGYSMHRDFADLRGKLGDLVYDIKKKVEEAHININDVKDVIRYHDPDEKCSIQLQEARDMSQVFFIVRTQLCSLCNCSILQKLAKRFNLQDGERIIQEYEFAKENYRRLLTSSSFADELRKESQFPSNAKGIIVLKLKWPSVKSLTVLEFENIIKEVFSELYCYMHLLKVEPGSIIATLCAPEKVTGALVALAKRSIVYLNDIRVTWLKIGETSVIDDIDDTEKLSQVAIEQDKPSSSSPNKVENILDNVDNLPSSSVGVVIGTVSQLSHPLVQAGVDDGGDDTDQGMGTDSATPMVDQTWRHYPVTPKEVMIIGSFGDHNNWLEQQHNVSPKLLTAELPGDWRKEEIQNIADLYSRNPAFYHINSVHYDVPGSECTKECYMEAIKQLFINCKLEGVFLYYTGHGEKDTGNWCFKDGVISFNDIFELYVNHFKGKPLAIVSDCSYSGNWINECSKRLDEMDVPSCGHHTRKQGLLFQIYTSCQPNEEATALCYVDEAVQYSEADKSVIYWHGATLSSGQKTMCTDFRYIYCSKLANESCEADADCTWNNRFKGCLLYCVRGKEKGRAAWHYVLVDEEKVADFKAQVATGFIDVADYGRILKSGWGEDPPKDIERKMELRFGWP